MVAEDPVSLSPESFLGQQATGQIVLDSERRVVLSNRKASELLGVPPDKLLGSRIKEHAPQLELTGAHGHMLLSHGSLPLHVTWDSRDVSNGQVCSLTLRDGSLELAVQNGLDVFKSECADDHWPALVSFLKSLVDEGVPVQEFFVHGSAVCRQAFHEGGSLTVIGDDGQILHTSLWGTESHHRETFPIGEVGQLDAVAKDPRQVQLAEVLATLFDYAASRL